MTDLSGRVAIVTGASEGIGLATAQRLAADGAHVVICARREGPLAEAEASIRNAGGSVEAHRLDVSDFDAYAALIKDVIGRNGRLDMMVNNAMSSHFAPVVDMTIEDWRQDFAVNADAVFIGTREAMRAMIPNRSGSIVNISSACGMRAMPNATSYSASKAALIHFTAAAAIEGAPHNVRVNTVVPGQVETPATRAFADAMPGQADATTAAIPMKRSGQPEELANVIAFLLSDEASYVTGVALPVDGGKTVQLYMPE
jgi:meso-butanediol dehydrogenase / (S,S)-butanediol dehydrogenase / diacetyl reductase